MITAKAIKHAIEALPEGKAFTAKELLQLGTRAAVDQTLYRMVKTGEVIRLARGIYTRPKFNKYVKSHVLPEPHEVAQAVAKIRGVKIGMTGAAAANALGLSTQVPTQAVFDTTGRTGKLVFGRNTIRFHHVVPKKMQNAGTSVGTAIAAVRYLGEKQFTLEAIAKLKRALNEEDFRKLRNATELPDWAMDRFYRFEKRNARILS
jgi:hypothetical protein